MVTDSEKRKRFGKFFCKEEKEVLENLTQKYKRTEEFLKFSDARQELRINLENALPEEFKGLPKEFDNLLTDILTAQQNYFYRYGFWDCCGATRS